MIPGRAGGMGPRFFAACLVGAYTGVHMGLASRRALLAASIAGVLLFLVVFRWWRWHFTVPSFRRCSGVAVWLLVALAVAASAGERLERYEQHETRLTRGARGQLKGRVMDVTPHSSGRVALVVAVAEDEDMPIGVGALGRRAFGSIRPNLRLIADEWEIDAMAHLHPPTDHGDIDWPVRLYPFSPRGNPGEFDAREWAIRNGWLANVYIDSHALVAAGIIEEVPWRPGGPDHGRFEPVDPCAFQAFLSRHSSWTRGFWARRLGAKWRCRVAEGVPSEVGAIAAAILLGQKDLLDPATRESFSQSGLGHLLAVSGLHVGFVIMVFLPLMRFARLVKGRYSKLATWIAFGLVFAGVAGYVVLVGGPPSALRAGTMTMFGLAARLLRRSVPPWHILGLVGGLLLFANPWFVTDLGFQMSFLATAGIVAFAPALWKRSGGFDNESRPVESHGKSAKPKGWSSFLRRFLEWCRRGMVISVAAGAATAPAVASTFSVVSWISPLTNLIAVPLAAASVLSLAVGVILGEVWEGMGQAALRLGHAAIAFTVNLATWTGKVGSVEVARPSSALSLGWYAFLAGLAVYLRGRAGLVRVNGLRWGRWAITLGLLLPLTSVTLGTVKGLAGVVEVWVLDVGQGDSILVRSPWGRTLLVDGGGIPGAAATGGYDVGEARVVPTLKRLGVRRVDMVVNTHPHEDHVQGLAAVIRQREVGQVYASFATAGSVGYRRFVDEAQARAGGVQHFSLGDVIQLEPGVAITALATGDLKEWHALHDLRIPGANDRSIVLLVEGKGGKVLLPGDVEQAGLQRLMEHPLSAAALQEGVDLLIVPHHGAPSSFSPAFIESLDPDLALISVGENRYGHPAPALLRFLEGRPIPYRMTRLAGASRVQLWPWGIYVDSVLQRPAWLPRP